MAKAFEGVRVIDFSQVLAGPVATAQLALLGADVVKIEQPDGGDQGRLMLAEDELLEKRMSPLFLSANAGKRSLGLDLKHPEAKQVLRRLFEGADVVVENFKAGTAERLGFGYEAVKAIKPDIVYCSISGYGQEGPNAGTPAYDGAIQAAAGIMSVTGHPETGPVRAGFMVVDMSTALTAAFAIAGALFRRAQTSRGQYIDVAMYDTALAMMAPIVCKYLNTGVEPRLQGNLSPALMPTGDVFPAADGYIQLSVLTDAHFQAMADVLGHPEWKQDPRFGSHDQRMSNGDAMRAVLREALAAESAEEWERRLNAANVACAALRSVPQALAHPQLAHRNLLMALGAPDGLDREITVLNASYTTSEDSPATERPPPGIGEHSEAILTELGFSAAEIARLREQGAI